MKVFSFNIHKGFSWNNGILTLPHFRDSLIELQPDVIFLQEIVGENKKHELNYHNWPKEGQTEFIAAAGWPHFIYGKNAIFSGRHHGNSTFSLLPIRASQNINLSTNRLEQRGLLHTEIALPNGKILHALNLHLDLTQSGRDRQLLKIINHIESTIPSEDPIILGGDFNDWNLRLTNGLENALGLKEVFQHIHGSHAKSFPSFRPTLRLDRLYFRHLRILHAECLQQRPWNKFSDHLPLYIEIEFS